MIRMCNVRGTETQRDIFEAGLHRADLVVYPVGQGPRLCLSLEESLAHILSQDFQILEGLEGKDSLRITVYVSEWWVRHGQLVRHGQHKIFSCR